MEILRTGGHFFEGARWHEGAWYVSDLYAHQVLRITEDGKAEVFAQLSTEPSGLGWLPNGEMLIVSMSDQLLLRRSLDGTIHQHADLSPYGRGWINDMAVDAMGRAFIGAFGFDLWGGAAPAPGPIFRVDPDGTTATVAEGLLFANGMVIAPDGTTLIVAESFGNRLSAFTIAPDGALTNRRIWAEFGPPPSWASIPDMLLEDYAPDGCAIDCTGAVWSADALHNRVGRIADGGKILEQVSVPGAMGTYSCALGGADGRTLLICSAPDFAHDRRAAKREAVLFVHRVSEPALGTIQKG